MSVRVRRVLVALLAALVVWAASGCSSKRSSSGAGPDPTPGGIVVNESSTGLLLTWVDSKGDFHVEQRVGDVPIEGRDAVRVVDPNREEGTSSDKVFVVDLRAAKPDGSYPVSTMTRSDFEALAVARREKAGPTLASAAPRASGSAAPPVPTNGGGAPDPNANHENGPSSPSGRPDVIIYGAEWCGPCHQAQAYLKKRGIAFVEKDVDSDPGAVKEMQAKLAKAGMNSRGSIPVIDVRGHMMIGFDAQALDDALGKPL